MAAHAQDGDTTEIYMYKYVQKNSPVERLGGLAPNIQLYTCNMAQTHTMYIQMYMYFSRGENTEHKQL